MKIRKVEDNPTEKLRCESSNTSILESQGPPEIQLYNNVDLSIERDIKILAVDAEWGWIVSCKDFKSVDPVSVQFTIYCTDDYEFDVYVLDRKYPTPSAKAFADHSRPIVFIHIDHLENQNITTLDKCLNLNLYPMKGKKKQKWDVLFFYSPVDIWVGVSGKEEFSKQLLSLKKSALNKKRNLSGTLFSGHAKLKDIFGIFNCSLEEGFQSVGIIDNAKDKVKTHEKSDMPKVAHERPDDLFHYAMGDIIHLKPAFEKKVEMNNNILKNALGIDPGWTIDNTPRSSGALVDESFRRFLAHIEPKSMFLLEKLAHVNNTTLDTYQTLCDEINKQQDTLSKRLKMPYRKGFKSYEPFEAHQIFGDSTITGKARASICGLGGEGNKENSAPLAAVVMGGRCNNEIWHEYLIKHVLDIDLASCYGSALKEFDYPFGRPRQIGYSPGSYPTLETVLEKYEHRFVPNLWQMTIEGKLSYCQDLIYSKIFGNPKRKRSKLSDAQEIKKQLANKDWWADKDEGVWEEKILLEKDHIDADFALTRKEIKNGILTYDTLKVYRKVATNKEWREFIKNMRVTSIAYYAKEDEVSM